MVKKKVGKKNNNRDEDWDDKKVTPDILSPVQGGSDDDLPTTSTNPLDLLGGMDDDEGGLMSMMSKSLKKGKKEKKKKVVAAFDEEIDYDQLENDDDVDVFGQSVNKSNTLSFDALVDEDEEEEVVAKKDKKKSKKNKKDLPSFDSLQDDVDNDEEIGEVVDQPIKAKKGKKKDNKDDDLAALAALIEDDSVPAPTSSKAKKGKKKPAAKDDDLEALAALIEDDSVPAPTAGKGKKGKGKKKELFEPEADLYGEEASSPATKEINLDEEPVVQIKSAKQKEKERKERAKLEKKKQEAERKKLEDDDGFNESSTAEPVAVEDTKGKGKKKGPAGKIALLRKQMEAQRALEEQIKKLEEEEKARIEEEERVREEKERVAEAARLARKAKEAEKREQLRKEGKLLTKAQKEAKRKAELRKESLLKSGVIIEGINKEGGETDRPKRMVYGKKKDKKDKPSPKIEEVKVIEPVVEEKKEEVKEEEEDGIKESWEDSDDGAKPKEEEEEDIKESWEDESEEEKDDKEIKPEINEDTKGDGFDSSEDDSEDDDEDSSSDEELTHTQRQVQLKKKEANDRRKKRVEEALAARSKDDLRSPICCILGHVDTGKTKLLDKIRQTNVQEGEAGGITQQIGATYFPIENIIQKTEILKGNRTAEYNLPGLLVIDTPGHESFTNLRSRGSSLCNIAILVVDIMHGLEQQTLESIRLLKQRKTPFIVALNKIDRIYDWQPTPNNGFQDSLSKQSAKVKEEFDTRVQNTITAFAEQGLNAKLYYENKNFAKYVSFVPTSAITGEGIPDILDLLVTLTQTRLTDKLMYVSELECTVLEVKVIEGLGTTIDVVLSNGYLNEGDKIVVCGLNGPIVTQIRALLTPQPLRELRVKSQYVHHKRVKAALGIKISAPDLEKAIAGSRLLVVGPDDDEEDLMDEVMEDLQTLLKSIDTSGRGVSVQASTLGSLEALLEYLRVSKIPVSAINIGPVFKKDIIRTSTMVEKAKEYAVMLAFDVEVDKDAQQMADQLGVKIFTADIIYHLFDAFTAYSKEITEQRRKEQAPNAVFPCILKMIPGAIFSRRDPILFGADVLEGTLRLGTPICVVHFDPTTKKRDIINLGTVTGIESNHKPVEMVKRGQAGAGVAVKIESGINETPKLFGRHFTEKDEFYSHITRKSIDVLKESFREDLSKEEWVLVVKLKKILEVN